VLQESSNEIPISSRTFDIVTCFGLLEHLPEEIRTATIGEAARLIKRSGRIYLVVNNIDNPFLSRNYPLKRQRPDGYFVSLVGLKWLRSACRKTGLTLKVRAANPWYGLVHYHLYPYLKQLALSHGEFKKICTLALQLDSEGVLPPEAQRLFASHFLVELRSKVGKARPRA
jgi:SAM-dependent methyltransferase